MSTVDPVLYVKHQMNTEELPSEKYPYEIPCDVEPTEETEGEEPQSLEEALTSL